MLPVFNESDNVDDELERIHKSMDASNLSYEVIVVDDGSSDDSAERLVGREDIRLIRFAQNRGTGSARKFGSMSARGRVVVWTDVDMTYPNDQIPELVGELDGWDQVVGARNLGAGDRSLSPSTGEMVHPKACWLPHRGPHTRPQLGFPCFPA